MANPALITCRKDTWEKVATDVKTGQIHKMTEKPYGYFHTYRLTGQAAPTEKNEGVEIFVNNNLNEGISFIENVDIYIFAVNDNGQVRVDL